MRAIKLIISGLWVLVLLQCTSQSKTEHQVDNYSISAQRFVTAEDLSDKVQILLNIRANDNGDVVQNLIETNRLEGQDLSFVLRDYLNQHLEVRGSHDQLPIEYIHVDIIKVQPSQIRCIVAVDRHMRDSRSDNQPYSVVNPKDSLIPAFQIPISL